MNLFFLSFSLVFALFLSSCTDESKEATTVISDDDSFNDLKVQSNSKYTLQTVSGKKINLEYKNQVLSSKDYAGKIVLINFWATWCKPCIEEMPSFNSLSQKYKDKFIIIGILFERNKNKKDLIDFIKKYKIKFPITFGEENFRIAKAFDDVSMIPESFIFDKNGKLVKKFIGKIKEKDLDFFINNETLK